jgi:hypothetical protein
LHTLEIKPGEKVARVERCLAFDPALANSQKLAVQGAESLEVLVNELRNLSVRGHLSLNSITALPT